MPGIEGEKPGKEWRKKEEAEEEQEEKDKSDEGEEEARGIMSSESSVDGAESRNAVADCLCARWSLYFKGMKTEAVGCVHIQKCL